MGYEQVKTKKRLSYVSRIGGAVNSSNVAASYDVGRSDLQRQRWLSQERAAGRTGRGFITELQRRSAAG